MDYDKLIRRLRNDADAFRNGETLGRVFADQEDVLDNAATAIKTLRAENEELRGKVEDARLEGYAKGLGEMSADLARVTAERDAAQALLAEISGVIGSAPITAAFGVPLERIRELVEADREGRCVVMEDLTISDLQQMLIVLDATCYGDGAETYTTGYRNGHRNGRIEILRHVLEIPEGDSSDTESALKAREQDGNAE